MATIKEVLAGCKNPVCVVASYGWILCGDLIDGDFDDPTVNAISINKAAVIRSWSGGSGLSGVLAGADAMFDPFDKTNKLTFNKVNIVYGVHM